jgi:uncharacterized protein (DUF849 family)
MTRTLQVALNGDSAHPTMPRTPSEIAADAAACVAAGANLLHLHAFDDDGVESLAERPVRAAIEAVRRSCPGVPISMTTFAGIEPDPRRRLAAVESWSVLPELIPANQGEPGILELTEVMAARGVGVEACVFTVAEAEELVRRGGVARFRRVVVEPMESDPDEACAHAAAMDEVLRAAGLSVERVHHGVGAASWPVLRQAAASGHGVRTGIEDVGTLPDGSDADGNVALVRAAAAILRATRDGGPGGHGAACGS